MLLIAYQYAVKCEWLINDRILQNLLMELYQHSTIKSGDKKIFPWIIKTINHNHWLLVFIKCSRLCCPGLSIFRSKVYINHNFFTSFHNLKVHHPRLFGVLVYRYTVSLIPSAFSGLLELLLVLWDHSHNLV